MPDFDCVCIGWLLIGRCVCEEEGDVVVGFDVGTESEVEIWLEDEVNENGTDVGGLDMGAGVEGKWWKVREEGVVDGDIVEVTGCESEEYREW